jgi:hypothetical protein
MYLRRVVLGADQPKVVDVALAKTLAEGAVLLQAFL